MTSKTLFPPIGEPIFYNLHTRNLRGDFYGGLTTAVVALPLSLAFGIASGLGPMAGLYCAIFLGFFASLFGGSPTQVSGPNGPMTVVMASIVLQFPDRPAMCFAAVILAGIMQIIGGAFKMGQYITLVPYPVISGFMSGVGVIIITLQLATLSGHTSFANMLLALQNMPDYWAAPNWDAVALGLIALFIVIFTPKRIGVKIPSPLLALVIGSVLGNMFFLNAPQIGLIPIGFPAFTVPLIAWTDIGQLIVPAAMLAILSSLDSLMTATIADGMTRIYHKPNKELIGQGIGNILTGLFGGIAGSGAAMRTSVNIRAGGRTPFSGMIHALILLGILIGLAPLAERIPHAVLAGILLKVGYDIIDWHFIQKFPSAPRFKVFLMLLVVVLTVAVDLITAVLTGVVLAALYLTKSLADAQLSMMRVIDHTQIDANQKPLVKNLLTKHQGHIIVHEFTGPLSFGAASQMSRQLSNFDSYNAVFLDLSQVYFIDTSSALAIEDIIHQIRAQRKKLYVIGLQDQVRLILEKLGVMRTLNPAPIYRDLELALVEFDGSSK